MARKRILPIEAVPGGVLEYEGLHGDDGTQSTVGALIAHITALAQVDPATLAEAVSSSKGGNFIGRVRLKGDPAVSLLDRFDQLKPATPEPLSEQEYDEFLSGGAAPQKARQAVARKLEKIFGEVGTQRRPHRRLSDHLAGAWHATTTKREDDESS